MFTEYFQNEQWQTIMPGVAVCVFADPQNTPDIPVRLARGNVEVIFCTEGAVTLRRENGAEAKLSSREILLLSNTSRIRSAAVTAPVKGLCIRVDTPSAGESFSALCRSLGDLPLSMHQVGEIMNSSGGFRILPVSPWSRAAFYTMKSIPQSAWGHFCILKTFELLYLLCTQNAGIEGQPDCSDSSSYLNSIAENMRSYMEDHLDEKLTILDLSRKFHLSRTACKSCFRSCFGQPIHSWILDRRMEQATDLLEHTNMPVLQIAQSVGYSGVSQFNAAFKQRYGKTPREYRKMSLSGC